MGCMVLFNSCQDDGTDSIDCLDLDCGENGTCGISAGLAVCFCDSSANGVLLYNGTNCENCIAWGGPCPPNSFCVESGCECDLGYIADTISGECVIDSTDIVDPTDTMTVVDTKALYLGTYIQTDVDCADTSVDPATLVDYATVDISESLVEDNVLFFDNLSALNDEVRVTLREDDQTRFEIPNQTTPNGHVFESLTIGTFNAFESGDTLLSIQYRLIPLGGTEDICILSLKKQ